MHFSSALASTTLLSLSGASPLLAPPGFDRANGPSKRSGIQWAECGLTSTDDLNNTFPILCGSLQVPLDYSEPNCTKQITLPLLKIAASEKKTASKSVLINFGGPGINGTQSLEALGGRISTMLGGQHDLITWYPRGTYGDLLFDCFGNATLRNAYNAQYPPGLGNSSDVELGTIWSNTKILADDCAATQVQNGSLVGTAFTARDMMQIVDALQEDGMLRYWGLSYGTILGATAAAMFPDRVDKVIIDGVVNGHEYYHNYQLTSRESSDDTLLGFCAGCLQTPALCPLAQNFTKPEELQSWIFNLLDTAKFNPLVIPAPQAVGGSFALTYTTLKDTIYGNLYSPASWPALATVLNAVANSDPAPILTYITKVSAAGPESDLESEQAIHCGDTSARSSSFPELVSYVSTLRTSRMGGDVEDQKSMQCAQWPFAAAERYAGNFSEQTANPLLVIGNTWDPATPLASARNMSMSFPGAVLLEQKGYGHTTLAQPSLCNAKAVQAYFNTGKLPDKGTVCEVEGPTFQADQAVVSWAKVLAAVNAGGNQTAKA